MNSEELRNSSESLGRLLGCTFDLDRVRSNIESRFARELQLAKWIPVSDHVPSHLAFLYPTIPEIPYGATLQAFYSSCFVRHTLLRRIYKETREAYAQLANGSKVDLDLNAFPLLEFWCASDDVMLHARQVVEAVLGDSAAGAYTKFKQREFDRLSVAEPCLSDLLAGAISGRV